MFEQAPTGTYASEVVEATIYDRTHVGDAVGRQMWLLNARVDRVIKGSINTSTVKILKCCIHFGGNGIVLGELEANRFSGVNSRSHSPIARIRLCQCM